MRRLEVNNIINYLAFVNMLACLIITLLLIFAAAGCKKWTCYQIMMHSVFMLIMIMQVGMAFANGYFIISGHLFQESYYVILIILNLLSSGLFFCYFWKVYRYNYTARSSSKLDEDTLIDGFVLARATKSFSDSYTSFAFKKNDNVVIFAVGSGGYAHCFANGEIGFAPTNCLQMSK
uniref:Uncharacterized protein n=1 Tax=Plectus sambesii TaxID=2011161 RepID=A0A914V981_9BILA